MNKKNGMRRIKSAALPVHRHGVRGAHLSRPFAALVLREAIIAMKQEKNGENGWVYSV